MAKEIVTSRNDIVLVETTFESNYSGSRSFETLILREWDADKQAHKPPKTLACASSTSQYDHSSGEDTYDDEKIENLREEGHKVLWEIRKTHTQENESTSSSEQTTVDVAKYAYDLTSGQLLGK